MFIALFISGATFAQTATVKHDQQVKASSNNEANAGGWHAAATANTSSEINAGSATSVSANQAKTQAGAATKGESTVTIDPSAIASAEKAAKNNVESRLEAGMETGAQLKDQTVKAGKAAAGRVKKITAAAARSTMQINGAVSNTLKIKAAGAPRATRRRQVGPETTR